MKRIAVLGSSGSIGKQTLDVVKQHADKLSVVGLAVNKSVQLALDQAHEYGVSLVVVADETCAKPHVTRSEELTVASGYDALEDLAQHPDVDIVVNALVGAAGLKASCAALHAGKTLALANKESLVVGGDIIMPLAAALDEQRAQKAQRDQRAQRAQKAQKNTSPQQQGSCPETHSLLPIDSEHGALFQCLLGEDPSEVSKLLITASGGPFRGYTRQQLRDITPEQALAHPTWNMGPKITIDSSTLMNKGLEVIEAHHLFALSYDLIEVVVQPQSAIHSMVEFKDGSVKAHLGTTDMRIPIQYALSYPERWTAPVKPLDFTQMGQLEFYPPDTQTFRCLELARIAGKTGGTLPCVMNAANEIAVAAFLAEEVPYLGIERCVESVMEKHCVESVESVDQLMAIDAWARQAAKDSISALN